MKKVYTLLTLALFLLVPFSTRALTVSVNCLGVTAGSTKSDILTIADAGANSFGIGNFNLDTNYTATCPASITIKKITFSIKATNGVKIQNPKIQISGPESKTLSADGVVKNNSITFSGEALFTIQSGRSTHISLIADVNDHEGQVQSTITKVEGLDSSTSDTGGNSGKIIKNKKPVTDVLVVNVLSKKDKALFDNLSNIKQEMTAYFNANNTLGTSSFAQKKAQICPSVVNDKGSIFESNTRIASILGLLSMNKSLCSSDISIPAYVVAVPLVDWHNHSYCIDRYTKSVNLEPYKASKSFNKYFYCK